MSDEPFTNSPKKIILFLRTKTWSICGLEGFEVKHGYIKKLGHIQARI